MRIYYAHHLWKYNTTIEQYEIDLIKKTFPEAKIVNPNTDIEQNREESEIMSDCIESVESCDALVFSSLDGVIGKGIFDEINNAREVYYIHGNQVTSFRGGFDIIKDSTTKRLYATVKTEVNNYR